MILTRYLDANEASMTDDDVDAFTRLMELSDNELMDLLLVRKEPDGLLDLPQVHALLARIRTA
ncbi:flavinator of succinate dehydrogenase family protein [Collimonas pratensis]|uniref:FAD assembly factor SdhE n=1 Tax=Collimonas pratensis TaxID=279113 RepID=A0A127Q3N7_9BURK|nr:flavinator of succinate dehydrogenase family protein [Collimonas pratensis]AMP15287.1 flavinator of succinate dehydrogenase family protein [Collimonas pratensis]